MAGKNGSSVYMLLPRFSGLSVQIYVKQSKYLSFLPYKQANVLAIEHEGFLASKTRVQPRIQSLTDFHV